MFKIGIDVTKTKKEGNVLKIEGIASSPVIDLDGERFSETAIQKMRDSVIKGNIPIRVEHESKFYSDIGIWKSADIGADGRLYVKGEIDLDLSMARDLEVLLRKGVKICMSVGGKVIDAVSEFVDKAQSWVTTYTDIELYEISIVKNPANQETTLSIAKSFNIETKEETEIAKSIAESAKDFVQVAPIEVEPVIEKSFMEKEMTDTALTAIFKSCYEYKALRKGERPQVEGNDLSDKEISKMANAFKTISERVRSSQTTASIAKNFYSLSNQDMLIQKASKAEEAVVAEAVQTVSVQATEVTAEATPEVATVEAVVEVAPVAEVVITPVAEVIPEPVAVEASPVVEVAPVVHGVGTVEKANTDGAEDVTPVVTEDAGTDSSLNNTGSETTTVTEVTPIETPVVSEVVPEVVVKSEVPVTVSEPVTDPTEGDVLAKAKTLVDSAIAEAIAPLVKQINDLNKSLTDADSVTKSRDETTQKNNEALAKALETITKSYEAISTQVSTMNSNVMLRKSSAVMIERKEDSASADISTPSGFNKAVSAEMDVNGGNYGQARNTILARLPQAS